MKPRHLASHRLVHALAMSVLLLFSGAVAAQQNAAPADSATPAAPAASLDGRIHDVVYLGSDTKYHVTLDAGGELAVIKQNVSTSSMEALAMKGRAVRLVWDRQHTLPVVADAMQPDGGTTPH